MQTDQPSDYFNQNRAASYDNQRVKMAPLKDALHLFIRMVLSGLPENANILCVGVGTGAELLELARANPNWKFTLAEPAGSMLDVCRQRAKDAGIENRCTFHSGYLATLPPTNPFDAATCLLVSHFIMDLKQRREFFSEIFAHLKSGGILINADLTTSRTPETFDSLLTVWFRMLEFSDMSKGDIDKQRTSFGRRISALKAHDMETLLKSSGFETPVLFYQALLISAWYSKRAAMV